MKDKRFDRSDIWIFLSITNQNGVPLDNVLAVADMLNHAIPTDNEIEKAINRLSSAGLVLVKGETFRLTESGHKLQEAIREKKGGLFTLVERMEKYLNRQDFPIIDIPEFKLRPGQLDEAYNTYQKRFEEISPKSKKRIKTAN